MTRKDRELVSPEDLVYMSRDLNKKPRIFIVDDSGIYRQLLERFVENIDHGFVPIREKSYDIHTFASAESCLANLYKKPDIIILDYHLEGYANGFSGMNGLRALKYIKDYAPRTKVIVVTGKSGLVTASQFIKKGASDFITKDIGIREKLQRSVSKAIRQLQRGEF
jgi:CheY-like chemotaxis protein